MYIVFINLLGDRNLNFYSKYYYAIFSLFLKFYHYVCEQLHLKISGGKNVRNGHEMATRNFKYAQYYRIERNSQNPVGAVGKPLVHKSALQQTTGTVHY